MVDMIDSRAREILFEQARSFSYWQDRPVEEVVLRQVYELAKMGPTSLNSCPARFVFLQSGEAKKRLVPALAESNVHKAQSAPVVAIVASDMAFYEKLPVLFPHQNVKPMFEGNADLVKSTVFRNSSLQGAYLIMAARACGLDCGPMSGFSNDEVDKEFFAGTRLKSNFLCCLGYGDRTKLHPRLLRLDFDEVCEII